MNGKFVKIGLVASVVALAGMLAASTTAFAQSGTPPTPARGSSYGMGMLGAGGGPENSLVSLAARVLAMERTELIAALGTGQTIAEVAAARGVAFDTLLQAVLAPRAEAASQAVAAGRMTQAQADAMLATLRTNVITQLNTPHTPGTGGRGARLSIVDANGDGVCDNAGAGQPRGRRGGR